MKTSTPKLFIILSPLCLADLPEWLQQEPYDTAYHGIRADDGAPVITIGERNVVCTNVGLFGRARDMVQRGRAAIS